MIPSSETNASHDAMIRVSRAAVSWLLAAALLIGTGSARAADSDTVAQRGDVRLTEADLKDTLDRLDPAARAQVTANPQNLAAFARERLMNMAVLAEAKSKSWDQTPDVMKKLAETRDAVILQTYLASTVPVDPNFPGDADVAAAYEQNRARLTVPKQLHVAQIVLLVPRDASAKDEEDIRKKALDLRAQAAKPKADFAELARKNSQETSTAEKGGDVGWIREPDMLPAVREAVSALSDNGISQPVRAPDGWHVLKLLETKQSGPVPLADAKPQLVQALRQARSQRLMRAYLDTMLKTQPIEVNEIALAKAAGEAK